MNIIETESLYRVFRVRNGIFRRTVKDVTAVDGISLGIGKGELFGLLGPNGAGKTTTCKMLTTLLIPTSGTAKVCGHDVVRNPRRVQRSIGFIFGGERGLYWRLSGIDNLRYFAGLYHVDPEVSKKRIPYLLELVGLKGRGDEKVEGYSRGMKQRLHVARTLLHDPEVLFLDEPTIGLDPVGAREFRSVIKNLQAEKKTILLTTHYMFEADSLCERIAVINHGRIIAMDTPSGLKNHVRDLSVIEVELFDGSPDTVERVRSLPFADSVSVSEGDRASILSVQTARGSNAVAEIVEALAGGKIGRVTVREPSLEDAYVRLVGGSDEKV